MLSPAARARRSALYLPASNARAIEKARGIAADVIIFDLEDAVAPNARAQAREQLTTAFAQGGFSGRETVIRCNEIGSPDYRADLVTIAGCAPDAILLPKVSTLAQIDAFRADSAALPSGIQTWFMIETVAALGNLAPLVAAGTAMNKPLACLVVGTNDIARETGVSADDGRLYLLPWLMNIILVAKQHGVAVLDGVWNDFRNMQGYEAEVRQSTKMGFDGKTSIHPSQVEPANRAFLPSDEALALARAIVATFARPEHAQAGVINLDGRMIERLHLEQAVRLLALHNAMEKSGDAA